MTLSFTKIILGLAMLGFVASLSTGSLSRTSPCDHVCPSPACDVKADRSIKQCKKCAECHAKQDAKFDSAAMVALVEDLADEASAEEPATFSSEENMDEMDQSSRRRRRRWGHRHHRHHRHHPHKHHPHSHNPHRHSPHLHVPHSHTVCQDGKTHGQEFFVFDATGKYCYHAVIGTVVEQGSRDEAKCNKASFAKKILVGKGSGTSSAYTDGDSAHCDGPREATLTITASTAAKSSSATVTEPSKCKYAIHMTVPKTCTTTTSNKVWYCAIHHSSGNRVLRKTWSLPTAQAALGVGSSSQQQAIIPMSGSLVTAGGLTSLGGDPHKLAKGWGTGSMWWGGWNQINSMRQKCAQESAPPAGTVEDLADEASAEEPATEDLADEASAEEPATFSSEENMDEMDQSSRRRRRRRRWHAHRPIGFSGGGRRG